MVSKFVSLFYRHAPTYILGCLTGFLLSAFLFNLITPSTSALRASHLSAFISSHSPHATPSSSYPLAASRKFIDIHDEVDHLIPDDLDLLGAAIHSNHSTSKLLACLEQQGPTAAIIVPTRSHPSFAITVLDPNIGHATSIALLRYGVDDVHLLHVLAPLLHAECGIPQEPPGLVVIQSADIGFISLYAANVGCPVLMLETRHVMTQALNSSLCANPHFRANLWLESISLNGDSDSTDIKTGKDNNNGNVKLVRMYQGIDSEQGDYLEEQAESHMDCTQPSVNKQCQDIRTTTLVSLLSPSSSIYSHFANFPNLQNRHIFFLQLTGDTHSIQALLNAGPSLLATYRIYHILLPFRPHLIGLELSKRLLMEMDRYGYEIAEIPYISPDEGFSLFQTLKSYLASTPFTSLASYTRALKYNELHEYAEKIFECSDKEQLCRIDLLFTLMTGRFTAGIVPHVDPKYKLKISNTKIGGTVVNTT